MKEKSVRFDILKRSLGGSYEDNFGESKNSRIP
jgi:hypothetical protein